MQLFDLYQQALSFPEPAEQQNFLAQLASKSAVLAAQLAELLAATPDAHSFSEQARQSLATAAGLSNRRWIHQLYGLRHAHWQIETLLGQGGMGVVYQASRQDGQFEQQVAIKVLDPLLYPVSNNQRSLAEAGLTAKLRHPLITQVYDAGVLQHEGQQAYYLVMEFVQGGTLTHWLQHARPTWRQVIQLFIDLSEAVQFAHQHQIIHADLKPSNVLVDAAGRPKLIDFGIANLQEEKPPIHSPVVSQYLVALSGKFASPEQLNCQPLTTLSDLYSLGQMMALLLPVCDLPPWTGVEFKQMIAKATATDAAERYPTVQLFASDLKALIACKPLSVMPMTARYRLGKLLRRQPLLSALSCGIFVAVSGMLGQFWVHHQSLQREQAATAQVAEFMTQVFTAADPQAFDGNQISAKDLLHVAKARLLDLKREDETGWRLQFNLAKAMQGITDYAAAEQLLTSIPSTSQHYTAARLTLASVLLEQNLLDRTAELLTEISTLPRTNLEILQQQNLAGRLAFYRDDYPEALRLFTEVQQQARVLSADEMLISVHDNLAMLYQMMGKPTLQLEVAEQAHQIAAANFAPGSAARMSAMHTLQGAYAAVEQYDKAATVLEALYQQKLAILPPDHPEIAMLLNEMGSNYSSLQQYDKAIPLHQKALSIIESRFGSRHIDFIYSHAYLGNAYAYLKQFNQANQAYSASLAAAEAMFGPEHLITIGAGVNLGLAYHEQGQHLLALPVLQSALARSIASQGEEGARTALARAPLGSTLLALGEYEAAKQQLELALAGFISAFGEHHIRTVNVKKKLAELASKTGGVKAG